MKFKRHIKLEQGLEQINIAPLIDVVFQLLIFFMLSSSFTFQSGIKVKLPRAITSTYINDKISTLKEVEAELSNPANKDRPILIKADRRASLGRVVDIWDLCRELGIERINIATDQDSP